MNDPQSTGRNRRSWLIPSAAWTVLLLPASACESDGTIRGSVTHDRSGLEACTRARVECACRAEAILGSLQLIDGSDVEKAYARAREAANGWCARQSAKLRESRVLDAGEGEFESQVRPAVDAFLDHRVPGARETRSVAEITLIAGLAIQELRRLLEERRKEIVDQEVKRLEQVLADMRWPGFRAIANEVPPVSTGGAR